MKILNNIIGLKRYFYLSCFQKEVSKKDLMTSNEALKAFGKIGLDYKADVMMMMASIEYEYGRNKNYTTREIGAVKVALAEVMKYFLKCADEWQEYETQQARKTLENKKK